MMKKFAAPGRNWDKLLANMSDLKAIYAEVERELDAEDAKEGKKRYSLPFSSFSSSPHMRRASEM